VRQLPNMVTNPCKKGTYGVFGTYLGYKKVRQLLLRVSAAAHSCPRATREPAESLNILQILYENPSAGGRAPQTHPPHSSRPPVVPERLAKLSALGTRAPHCCVLA